VCSLLTTQEWKVAVGLSLIWCIHVAAPPQMWKTCSGERSKVKVNISLAVFDILAGHCLVLVV